MPPLRCCSSTGIGACSGSGASRSCSGAPGLATSPHRPLRLPLLPPRHWQHWALQQQPHGQQQRHTKPRGPHHARGLPDGLLFATTTASALQQHNPDGLWWYTTLCALSVTLGAGFYTALGTWQAAKGVGSSAVGGSLQCWAHAGLSWHCRARARRVRQGLRTARACRACAPVVAPAPARLRAMRHWLQPRLRRRLPCSSPAAWCCTAWT